jgi:hypothetical protein
MRTGSGEALVGDQLAGRLNDVLTRKMTGPGRDLSAP